MKSINAIGDKVFAEVIPTPAEITVGGIILPGKLAEEPQNYCLVKSVGEDVKTIKVGDTIVIHPRGGMTVMFDTITQYRILKYDEIYGILELKDGI